MQHTLTLDLLVLRLIVGLVGKSAQASSNWLEQWRKGHL